MRKFADWTAVVFWMAIVFVLSSQSAVQSAALSGELTTMLLGILQSVLPGSGFNAGEMQHFLRKAAHFLLYFVLGILIFNALRQCGGRKGRSVMLAVLLCSVYAAGDEVHQLFSAGRSAQLSDVLLDSAGAAAGIAARLGWGKRQRGVRKNDRRL